jgi:hypothetical protein
LALGYRVKKEGKDWSKRQKKKRRPAGKGAQDVL